MSWNTAHTAIATIGAISIAALIQGHEIPYEVIVGALGAWATARQVVKSVANK